MSTQTAALVLAWLAIVLLTAAVAACVRALRFQEARLLQVLGQPQRLRPGDTLALPRTLAARLPQGTALLLFGTSECASCKEALRLLAERARGFGRPLPLVALFRGAAPADAAPPGGGDRQVLVLADQAPVFDDLNVGLLPFAVLVRGGEVLAAGAVGSPESVDELWRAVELSPSMPGPDWAAPAAGDGLRRPLPLLTTTDD